jgi:hypothetical protein
MRIILLFCITISFVLAPAAAQRAPVKQNTDVAQYIGLRYGPTLPPGFKLIGGSLVSAVGDNPGFGV